MNIQRGGFAIGLVVGLLSGRTAEQDNAEAERNRSWDPNAPLAGRSGVRGAASAATNSGVVVPAPGMAPILPPPAGTATAPADAPPATAAAPPGTARDPAAILSGAPGAAAPQRSTAFGGEPFVYFVQAGAFTRSDDAEQQRAKLALMGQVAQISEREQAGRVVYRVRMGPYRTRDDADVLRAKLQSAAIDAQIVRVERP